MQKKVSNLVENSYVHDAWTEEETIKEQLYTHLDQKRARLDDRLKQIQNTAAIGDDKELFHEQGKYHQTARDTEATKKLIDALSQRPYHSHIDIVDCEDGQKWVALLSDNADIDSPYQFGEASENCYIYPFSSNAPMVQELFSCSYGYSAEQFSVNGINYQPQLLRKVEIENRELQDVQQYFPVIEDANTDEFLVRRLEENRDDPSLQNIISTLQRRQFDVIRQDIEASFVVQGCAGSGKTQCLILRLRFLRVKLKEQGWEKVLLLTPSKLFRDYSMQLIRDYHLNEIKNCSIIDLYCEWLSVYDSRFKERQYRIEMTEEYLPDEYLRQVYSQEEMQRVFEKIETAIQTYIKKACDLIEEPFPDTISTEYVSELLKKVDERIRDFDEEEQLYESEPEYTQHRAELDQCEKKRRSLAQEVTKIENELNEHQTKKLEFDRLSSAESEAKDSLTRWTNEIHNKQSELSEAFKQCCECIDMPLCSNVAFFVDYIAARNRLIDYSEECGKQYQENKKQEESLNSILEDATKNLRSYTKPYKKSTWMERYEAKLKDILDQRTSAATKFEENETKIEQLKHWIIEFTQDPKAVDPNRKQYREDLGSSKYYLGRLESTIFEKEVWNTLAPDKEKYKIQTLEVQSQGDGHQNQIRILYKSDLIFYLYIYEKLYTKRKIPAYKMICIDEGQDLHSIDYKILRKMNPGVVFNVFGDTVQTLHESCGIQNWEADTGIDYIEIMDTNYRNRPEIVNFCRDRFNAEMKGIGIPKGDAKDIVLSGPKEVRGVFEKDTNAVIIVRGTDEYQELSKLLNSEHLEFDYLDSVAEKPEDGKVHVYSIFASKGLEFSDVLVFGKNMTNNQKIVACTRAMKTLYYYEGGKYEY